VKDGTSRSLPLKDLSSWTLELDQEASRVLLEVQVSHLSMLDYCVDLQTVNISLRVMFKPDEKKLFQIYRNLGLDYDGRVLPSVVHEILKSVVARYTVAQLAHQREQVSSQIRASLTERLREFMIELDDVAITELSFSPQYQRAVESKQIAEQDAIRAKYLVEKAHQEKKSKIVWAEGEAQAIKDLGERIGTNYAYLDLLRI